METQFHVSGRTQPSPLSLLLAQRGGSAWLHVGVRPYGSDTDGRDLDAFDMANVRPRAVRCLSSPLNHHGDALADAYAHGNKGALAAGTLELAQRGERDTRA